jgi:phage-related protein
MGKKLYWQLEDWLLLFGGIWLIHQVFKSAQTAGIGALPDARRFLIPYVKGKVRVFDNELKNLSTDEGGEVIRLIIEARVRPVLSAPIFRRLRGNKYIDCEFRKGQWRIFARSLPDGNYLIVSFFKKKTDETPKAEIEKAERRIREYLGSKE